MPEIRIPDLGRDQADGQIGGAEQALCLLHFLLNDIILQVHAGLFLKKPGHVIRIQVDSLGQFFPAQLVFQMLGNISHNDLHDVPSLNGFNFVMKHALGGGATMSLRLDSLGKSMGSAVMRMKIHVEDGEL